VPLMGNYYRRARVVHILLDDGVSKPSKDFIRAGMIFSTISTVTCFMTLTTGAIVYSDRLEAFLVKIIYKISPNDFVCYLVNTFGLLSMRYLLAKFLILIYSLLLYWPLTFVGLKISVYLIVGVECIFNLLSYLCFVKT